MRAWKESQYVLKSDWLCTIENGSVRLGLMYVVGLREKIGRTIEKEQRSYPFTSIEDLYRRSSLSKKELRTLAEVGALNGFGMKRRQALW